MADRWSDDPRYAHGYLVPVFSLALLWMRKDQIQTTELRPTAWALPLIALGAALQLAGGFMRQSSVEGSALLPYLAGLALLVGGWPALRWSWPSILCLVFMIPLPWSVERAMGPPLQWLATLVSTYTLQTLGFMAFSEGNVIQLNNARVGVVEACSGLSMLITFVALSTGMAIVVKRPILDKVVLILSAIPVALVANIARITLTGVLHERVGGKVADHFYHDLAGWIMIPFALVLYWGVGWLFAHILVEVEPATVLVGVSGNEPKAAPKRAKASHSSKPAPALPRARRRR
jgi:exosortase